MKQINLSNKKNNHLNHQMRKNNFLKHHLIQKSNIKIIKNNKESLLQIYNNNEQLIPDKGNHNFKDTKQLDQCQDQITVYNTTLLITIFMISIQIR